MLRLTRGEGIEARITALTGNVLKSVHSYLAECPSEDASSSLEDVERRRHNDGEKRGPCRGKNLIPDSE